jgi:light-regulated signal transduction histidine kinase (bacteriophytochrome)
MVTALGLYCDLLEEPGVLAAPFAHYGNELRLVAAASRRLVEKLVALDVDKTDSAFRNEQRAELEQGSSSKPDSDVAAMFGLCPDVWADQAPMMRSSTSCESHNFKTTAIERAVSRTMERVVERSGPSGMRFAGSSGRLDLMLAAPIQNMARELLANQNLLAALAGPSIALSVHVDAAAKPVRLTGEDFTRVMVNLVKNSAEAMRAGGSIHIELCSVPADAGTAEAVRLTMEDNGPGIAAEAQETIFCSGYSTRKKPDETEGAWPASHRGLGLAITRSIVEAAGGRIQVSSHAPTGARFEIELPVRKAGR